MTDPDVERLRHETAQRARARPRLPFDGSVRDVELGDAAGPVQGRCYRPDAVRRPGTGIVFLHGGYGVLGDLDLQDGACRRIAAALGAPVLAVDYRLAPEHTLSDSTDDAVVAALALRRDGVERVVLWGDSAGGAVALAAARRAAAGALVLTNPNVDLTLAGYDDAAPGGPDRELSAWAFARWAGAGRLDGAPDLAADVAGLPPVLAAVGSEDSLLPDSRRLIERLGRSSIPAALLVVPGASHGFLSGHDERVDGVLTAAAELLDQQG
jgi:acetyl esterase